MKQIAIAEKKQSGRLWESNNRRPQEGLRMDEQNYLSNLRACSKSFITVFAAEFSAIYRRLALTQHHCACGQSTKNGEKSSRKYNDKKTLNRLS